MKIVLPKYKVFDPEMFIRRCGYGRILDRHEGRISYVRRLTSGLYPRFHVYVDDLGDDFSFNLHLDQRAPVYRNVTAHAGEYDGATVEAEAARIRVSAGV